MLGKHLLEAFPSLSRETSTLMKVLDTKKPIVHQDLALSKLKWGGHLYSKYDVTYFHRLEILLELLKLRKIIPQYKNLPIQ
ncbi:hypothetical protein ACT7DL_11770 [Bacillus paranthracis]